MFLSTIFSYMYFSAKKDAEGHAVGEPEGTAGEPEADPVGDPANIEGNVLQLMATYIFSLVS